MFRDFVRLLWFVGVLDEDELALRHGVGAKVFCRALPRLRARLQTIEKLAEVEVIEFDAIDECHNWQHYLARYANIGKRFPASLKTKDLAPSAHGSRKTMDTR